jgi:hypothetical protein
MSEELRPCPFCGGEKIDVVEPDNKDFVARCLTCGARGPANNWNPKEAIKEWSGIRTENTRPNSWQPIETAPRDGTDILVWDRGLFNIAYWSAEYGRWYNYAALTYYPTYWMPLPDHSVKEWSVEYPLGVKEAVKEVIEARADKDAIRAEKRGKR